MATRLVFVDCARVKDPSVDTIDSLARLQLALTRCGRSLHLIDASNELRALIELAGLAGVLCVEVERQPEERKQPRGVEEESEFPDASA